MNDFSIYAGDDFSMIISASPDVEEQETLEDYELVVQFSTKATGRVVVADTQKPTNGVDIVRDGNTVAVNVSHALTRHLSEGVMTVSVMLTHKESKARIITEMKTVEVKRSKLINV